MNKNFKFNDELCRQIDGVTMNSPLGSVLTEIFSLNWKTVHRYSELTSFHFTADLWMVRSSFVETILTG